MKDLLRHANPFKLSESLYKRSDVYRVSENVSFSMNYVTEMDANLNSDLVFVGNKQPFVLFAKFGLNFNRALNSIQHVLKFNEKCITNSPDLFTMKLREKGPQKQVVSLQVNHCQSFVVLDKRGKANDLCEHYCCKFL